MWNEFTGATEYILKRDGNAVPLYSDLGFSFEDTGLTASTQYSYTLEVMTSEGTLSEVSRASLYTTPATGDKTCVGDMGIIEQNAYDADATQTWLISPPNSFEAILLNVSGLCSFIPLSIRLTSVLVFAI